METLSKIQTLVASMTVDADKVYKKGNRSASIRARKYAQDKPAGPAPTIATLRVAFSAFSRTSGNWMVIS